MHYFHSKSIKDAREEIHLQMFNVTYPWTSKLFHNINHKTHCNIIGITQKTLQWIDTTFKIDIRRFCNYCGKIIGEKSVQVVYFLDWSVKVTMLLDITLYHKSPSYFFIFKIKFKGPINEGCPIKYSRQPTNTTKKCSSISSKVICSLLVIYLLAWLKALLSYTTNPIMV